MTDDDDRRGRVAVTHIFISFTLALSSTIIFSTWLRSEVRGEGDEKENEIEMNETKEGGETEIRRLNRVVAIVVTTIPY